jgi:NAD(P)H-hydrate epimerase
MKVVTALEMAEIDRLTIEEYGIPSLLLMERAALGVCKHIINSDVKNIIILAGPGNNGGDGVAVGRILKNKSFNVKIFQPFSEEKLSANCKIQIEIAKKYGVAIFNRYPTESELSHATLLVDALFGTGLKKIIDGDLAKLINLINSLNKTVIAVDIPSGVSADNGEILGYAIKATLTVTFGLPKRGHILFPGREFVGKLIVEDIGFPSELTKSEKLKVSLIEKDLVHSLIPKRHLYSHKGNYGHVLVIAGSVGKTGAALMCGKSALRAGAGLVTMAVPAALKIIFQSKVLEEMVLPLPCTTQTLSKEAIKGIEKFIYEQADVVAFGPGVGVNEDTEEILKFLLLNSPCPIVIDADGITLLVNNIKLLEKAKTETVITPHPGELSRLIKLPVKEIEKDRIDITQKVAKDLNTVVVLKGVPTVISNPLGNTFINTTGNPGMATGGAGDVLTGIIASFIGQGLKALDASIVGVYVHGLSGDIASKKKGYHGLIAGDLIDNIPSAIKELTDEMDKKS